MSSDSGEEERIETPSRAIRKLKLTCVSLVIDSELNGDQLRLSPRILERIVNQEPMSISQGFGPRSNGRDYERPLDRDNDGPMVFSLELQEKTVYGAPKEFTAKEERQVVISLSLAKALGISENSTTGKGPFATLELVDIPRGSFVRLAPLTPNYLLIPDIR
jgi:hypothetical protein